MATAPLYILLCSDQHERIQMAAMLASVAAVSDRPTEVFVSMGALAVFERGLAPEQRYKGGAFAKLMRGKNVPDAVALFQQGKDLGGLRIWACSMALDVHGWELDRLVDGLFDEARGLTKFLSDAEGGELVIL